MIGRVWHGWTTVADADTYESLLRREIFRGIEARGIPGVLGIDLLRRPAADTVEFVTILWFDSVDAVRAFAGPDYEAAVVPPAARALLTRFDERSAHYEVRERRKRPAGGGGAVAPDAPAPALRFRDARPEDAPAIAALHNAAAGALTARFGEGHWSGLVTERSALLAQRHARVRVGVVKRRILTVLRLATKKPWAIDVTYFTPVRRPLYLTGMAVSVAHQGRGLGRAALRDACTVAAAWPADAIRLDAYDAVAGAGWFYAKGGFRECGRVRYRGDPLVYFERLLREPA
jgi:ribosomal protein S18 acetylase RimI-like enzyme